MKQYEIWWANLPAPAGRRPVLLLSRDSAYQYLNKFVVAEITTTVRRIVEEVPLGKAEGLPRLCAANCDNLRTRGAFEAGEEGGSASRESTCGSKESSRSRAGLG